MNENHSGSDEAPAGGGTPENAGMASDSPGQTGEKGAAAGVGQQSGEMHAYDIPRYDSRGHVVGRPDTANDPNSAGRVQGRPAQSFQQVPSGYADPGQAPPQGMVYGGMHPPYGSVPPGFMPVGQPGMQMPYPGMAYSGMGPVYGPVPPGYGPMDQPGMQAHPQGMAHQATDPAYGPEQTEYQQVPPGSAAQHSQAEQYGRIADVVQDISNGEQPDVSKIVQLFSSFDSAFWKGALMGALIALLVTNETVKEAIAGTLGNIMGAFKQDDAAATDADVN